jgi:hypothetical protein
VPPVRDAPISIALGRRAKEADPALGAFDAARPLGVYVHFPFCGVHCPYCDFAVDDRAVVPDARPTVPLGTPRAPHITSWIIPGLPAEPILHALEARGIFASAGSACASRSKDRSHVLAAIGVPESAAVLRFSLSRTTREEDLQPAAQALRAAIDDIAPLARARGQRRS